MDGLDGLVTPDRSDETDGTVYLPGKEQTGQSICQGRDRRDSLSAREGQTGQSTCQGRDRRDGLIAREGQTGQPNRQGRDRRDGLIAREGTDGTA